MRQEINKKKETGEGGREIAWSTAVLLFFFFFVRLSGPHSDQPNWAYHETKRHLFPTSLPVAPTQTTQPRFPNLTSPEPEPEPVAPHFPSYLYNIPSPPLLSHPKTKFAYPPLLSSNSNKISFFISAAPKWVFFFPWYL